MTDKPWLDTFTDSIPQTVNQAGPLVNVEQWILERNNNRYTLELRIANNVISGRYLIPAANDSLYRGAIAPQRYGGQTLLFLIQEHPGKAFVAIHTGVLTAPDTFQGMFYDNGTQIRESRPFTLRKKK